MNYNETLEFIHSLGNFSLPAGLDRIKKVMSLLCNPQNEFKSIHIAGTNGKGSVSAMLANVFKGAGLKTGLFISPFIINFRERIQINGEYISEEDLCLYAERVRRLNVPLTEFEFITAMAFLYFKAEKIDILICETGLGGRLDATNILEKKSVSVITKIGLDHIAVLGDTVEKIAAEKCGILRACPTVTSPYQPEEALNVIRRNATELTVPDVKQFEITENGFIYNNEEYELSLYGDFQVENALVVIEAVKHSGYSIPYNIIYKALKSTCFPARMELISKSPLVVLDGAHNPDGALVLAKELKKYSGRVTAIIGMMKDKDYEGFLKATLCYCKNAVAVEVHSQPRTLSADDLVNAASEYTLAVKAYDYTSAIEKAADMARGEPIFVFGSLYLASAIRDELKRYFK